MAPEVLNYKTHSDYDAFKSDIYSMAIVLYAFIFKCFPDSIAPGSSFGSGPTKEIYFPEIEPDVSESSKQLINNMTSKDISKRFSLIQVLDSDWINSNSD